MSFPANTYFGVRKVAQCNEQHFSNQTITNILGGKMFNERPQTQEIILTKLDTSRKLERPLKKGDSVSLRIGDERINVKIDTVSGSSFKGTITEFHPSRGLTFQQLKLHDEIEFETKHIFSASLA